jgi:hypothetical protein
MFRLRSVAPSAIAPLIEQFDRLARIYPEVAERIVDVMTGPLPVATQGGGATTWARAASPPDAPTLRITLNDRSFDRLGRVQAARQEQISRRWHPSGTSDPAAFMTHEFGHHVMLWLQDRGVDIVAEMLGMGNPMTLSTYAATRFEEAFAEAFAAHYHGDAASKSHPTTRGVLDMIQREITLDRAERSRP